MSLDKVRCPYCGSDDTVVLAVVEGSPFPYDILCRKCRKIFAYSTEKKRHSILNLDYSDQDICMALCGKWRTKIYKYISVSEPILVGEL